MTLGASAILIALVVGVGAGVVGAVKPGSWADTLTLGLALVGVSLPSFITGTVLLTVFGVWLAWLPVGGWGTLGQLVLPAVTLSLPFAAYIARLTRLELIEQLRSDYVRTARAKGVRESAVVMRHALRNALLPVVSYLGPATAYAMTGSFVVERVFRIPGLGEHFVNSVLNKDLFLIIGTVLVFSTMLVVFNLAVDVAYRWIDPRMR
jgi:oligopeptide transport system permease protein